MIESITLQAASADDSSEIINILMQETVSRQAVIAARKKLITEEKRAEKVAKLAKRIGDHIAVGEEKWGNKNAVNENLDELVLEVKNGAQRLITPRHVIAAAEDIATKIAKSLESFDTENLSSEEVVNKLDKLTEKVEQRMQTLMTRLHIALALAEVKTETVKIINALEKVNKITAKLEQLADTVEQRLQTLILPTAARTAKAEKAIIQVMENNQNKIAAQPKSCINPVQLVAAAPTPKAEKSILSQILEIDLSKIKQIGMDITYSFSSSLGMSLFKTLKKLSGFENSSANDAHAAGNDETTDKALSRAVQALRAAR